MTVPNVTVSLDGLKMSVPASPCCHLAARGALGVARGLAVARESGETGRPDGEPALSLEKGFQFREGDRFVTVGVDYPRGE